MLCVFDNMLMFNFDDDQILNWFQSIQNFNRKHFSVLSTLIINNSIEDNLCFSTNIKLIVKC